MGPVEFHQGPPDANAEFVCQMEEVLNVSQRPYDPQRPVVCFDEGTKPLVKPVSPPIEATPGPLEIIDDDYERNATQPGTSSCSPSRWRVGG